MNRVKDINKYIKNVQCDDKYKDYITVEHRSNNPKRDFLFVNKYQCKHIPSSPSKMADMCIDLANIVNESLCDDYNILVIGFAETATAIGHIVANNLKNCKYVMCTTRENIDNSEYVITFEEEHSHATTQKLLTYKDDVLDISKYNYILFVEDEISTGNTILNFITTFKNKFKNSIKFGVASICNWQSEENINKFNELDIDRFYLISGTLSDVNKKMDTDGYTIKKTIDNKVSKLNYDMIIINYDDNVYHKHRLGCSNNSIKYNFETLINLCKGYDSIRIVGSEECMIPAIDIGIRLEKLGKKVICHSSTRSKIDIIDGYNDDETSGIKNGYCIKSAYDNDRKTYIYNVDSYSDLVLVISDTHDRDNFEQFVDSVASVCVNNKKVIGYNIQ